MAKLLPHSQVKTVRTVERPFLPFEVIYPCKREILTMAWDGKPKNVVGPAVQKLRVVRGWSQPELAAKCQMAGWDISRGIIAGIEGRMRWVGDWEALFLARLFHVSVNELYPAGADLTDLLAQSQADEPRKSKRR